MNELVRKISSQWEIAGLIFTILFGTAVHFIYAWSGKRKIVGALTAVNESVWEHLKLIFTPMLFFAVAEYYFIGKQIPNYLSAKFLSILFGMACIVILFYTYSGIVGSNFLWVDILTFFIAATLAHAFFLWAVQNKLFYGAALQVGAGISLILLTACFILFTYHPPHIGLFKDPVLHKYGI